MKDALKTSLQGAVATLAELERQRAAVATREAAGNRLLHFRGSGCTVNPIKLETGLRLNSAGIPFTLLFRIEAIGFPAFRLLL